MRKSGLIVAAILAFLVYGMSAAMLGTLLPELSRTFGFTDNQNGTIAFVRALGLIAASIAAGPIVDRRGKKFGVMLGFSILTAALVALALSAGYLAVNLSMLLVGLGGGLVVTGANALVSDIDPGRRAAMLTLLNLFFGVGGLLTPLIASLFFVDRALGFCWLIAALCAGTLWVYARTPMALPAQVPGFQLAQVRKVLVQPRLAMLSALLFLYVACEASVWDWLAKYLTGRGISEPSALRIVSFGFALGMLTGRAVAARVLIQIPAATVTLCCTVLITITTFYMLRTTNVVSAGVVVFCAGAAMAPVFPSTLGLIGDAFPVMGATAMGLAIMCGWSGLAIVSKTIGAIAGTHGLQVALLILPGLGTLMVAVSLALLLSENPGCGIKPTS